MQRIHDPQERGFASDNYSGVHPEVLAAIAEANGGHQVAYGEDVYTARLQEVVAQHFGNRAQQVFAHNRVVLGQHFQADVFVGDAPHHAAQHFGVVDVRGVGQHRRGEAAGLPARFLVGGVEDVQQLRVRCEHGGVEGAGNRFAVRFEGGNGGLDDGFLVGGQHERLLGKGDLKVDLFIHFI